MKQLLVLISFIGLFISSCKNQEREVDWNPYFESEYKTPLGTKVFRDELKYVFKDSKIKDISGNTEEYLQNNTYDNATYVYINPRFYNEKMESYHLLQFAKKSNSIFMASYFEDDYFLNELGVQITDKAYKKYELKLHYLKPKEQNYAIDNKFQSIHYFSHLPENAKVLGSVKIGQNFEPNFVMLTLKNETGYIFLHANPELFSNYYMLNKTDGLYALNTLNHLKHTSYLLWDGSGTHRRYTTQPSEGGIKDTLRFIFSSKSLSAAFFIAIAAMLLFAGFNYKRIIRSIPIHKPLNNNSLAFTKLVGNLFMDYENHIDLARYRMIYLMDNLKRKFNLDTSELDEQFTHKLAEKSAISQEELTPFVRQLNKIKNTGYLSKTDFLAFNKSIEQYTKKFKINKWKP